MNKGELIEQIASRASLSRADAAEALDALLDTVEETLRGGDTVALVGFGTFSVSQRSARMGKNPQTGAPIKIAARKVPKFSPGKGLKDAISGAKKAAAKGGAKAGAKGGASAAKGGSAAGKAGAGKAGAAGKGGAAKGGAKGGRK